MSNGDAGTAWALYDQMMEAGLSPHQDTWSLLFQGTGDTSPGDGKVRRLELLHHMRNNQVYPERGVADSIKTWFER